MVFLWENRSNELIQNETWALMEIILGKKYRLGKQIGSGSFGCIYQGLDEDGTPVAIKLESDNPRNRPILPHEARLYRIMSGSFGIPEFKWFGNQGGYNILVTEMLEKTLEDLMRNCGGMFTLKTTLMLAEELLSRIEYMHRVGIVHRDLKPENFMLSKGKIFVIDFGLSNTFVSETGEHIPMSNYESLTGTARYASINAMNCFEQSRRDDLESLGYIFVYFLKGKLPWQGIPAPDRKAKFSKIKEVKMNTSTEDLCHGIPDEFRIYLESTRDLGFTDEPDYYKYKYMFRNLMLRNGWCYDGAYDWCAPPAPEIRQKLPKLETPRPAPCQKKTVRQPLLPYRGARRPLTTVKRRRNF